MTRKWWCGDRQEAYPSENRAESGERRRRAEEDEIARTSCASSAARYRVTAGLLLATHGFRDRGDTARDPVHA
jgi:hypothetical protein